ncbi:MAG: urease accessory protein UreF [Pseudoduganella sp.]|nr:urease accessory protein UreF [Pseudoduganella sp.]
MLHLLQFASPALPVGAYSYSQGLEAAIEQGRVRDAAAARNWMASMLHEVLARWDAPVFWRLLRAHAAGDAAAAACWAERFLASRDTAELRAETVQMGFSLGRLLAELELAPAADGEEAYLSALARAVHALGIRREDALLAMLFGWAENQVLVCVKSIPLGQVAGQRLLLSLRPEIELAAQAAQELDDSELSSWAPGLSLLSMQHEVQHGRLYRS